MNTAIITKHSSHNYGAILQAYGLQAYIKENFDQNTMVINFAPDHEIESYKIFKRPKSSKSSLLEIFKLLRYKELKTRHSAFKSFIPKYFEITDKCRTLEQLKNLPLLFENYITGSDQVFNPNDKEVNAYYLEFCPSGARRIAYAPSFGYSSIPEEHKEHIRHMLNKFDFLSARERSGCRIIKELTGRDVPNVLDPVFLLNKEEWQEIENPVKLKFQDFILCYALSGFSRQIKLGIKLKMLTGLPLVLITEDPRPIKEADALVRFAGPMEFLWLFRNARFVVTDSFHGTAFSVVFKKTFFSHIGYSNKADRIVSLLENLSLTDRMVKTSDEINAECLEIDFNPVYKALERLEKISKQYLRKALKYEE